MLVARTKAALETLALTLRRDHKVRVEVIQADLGDVSAPESIANDLERMGIELDLLVNNAAVGYSGKFFSRPIEEELTPVVVNVQSLVALTHVLGKKMVARGSGGIINVGSTGGFQPVPYSATYAATKSFVLMFSEAVAEELKGSGVRVMVANPGATATEFFDQSPTTVKREKMDSAESVARRTLNDFVGEKGRLVPRSRQHTRGHFDLPHSSSGSRRKHRCQGIQEYGLRPIADCRDVCNPYLLLRCFVSVG